MSRDVYRDQIWVKSGHIGFFREVVDSLNLLTKSLPQNLVATILVDLVPDDVINQNKTIITDNFLNVDYIGLSPEFWGAYRYQSDYINRIPVKLFNCFIHRACSRRQIWFYEFVRRNLLDQGSVSFLLNHRIHKCSTIEEKQKLFEKLYIEECGDDFINEHEKIKSLVPYSNFKGELDQIIVDSKVTVLIETFFMGAATTFTEKTFRALQLPRPMLLYNNTGAVAILREFGFDLYDDIINHDEYDKIEHPEDRMSKILSILEDFKNFNYTENILLDFEQRAQKNRDLLISFRKNWPARLKKVEEQINLLSTVHDKS